MTNVDYFREPAILRLIPPLIEMGQSKVGCPYNFGGGDWCLSIAEKYSCLTGPYVMPIPPPLK